MRRALRRAVVVIVLAAGSLALPPAGSAALGLRLAPVVAGLERPLLVTHAGDGSGRLFVVLQGGTVRIVGPSGLLDDPYLDLGALVLCCGEGGLLGLAFHPDYAANGRLYVHYVDLDGRSVIAAYSLDASDPNRADPASAEILLTLEQPYPNHNGGHLAFGPDGYLYAAFGDGGSGGDPGNRAQDLTSWHGSILRVDVDGAAPGLAYAIPPDNPLVDAPPALPEIWSYGLRNPWRFSFDRATGDLWIGDVGQGRFEEIDLQPAASPGGENWGWRILEGDTCYEPPTGCDPTGTTPPLLVYSHDFGCSVTGGYRYRGAAWPRLAGIYLFGDYCSGEVWGAAPACEGGWSARPLAATGESITSFGEDEAGELYLTSIGGGVFRIEPDPAALGQAIVGDPAAVDLGALPVGGSASLAIELAQADDGPEAVRVERFELVGDPGFSLDPAAGYSPCGDAPCLETGSPCSVEVAFTASSHGAAAATLRVEGNFPPLEVPLEAAGYGDCELPSEIDLDGQAVTDGELVEACRTIRGGAGLAVGGGTEVVLRAGIEIAFGNETVLASDVRLELDPLLALGD